jgi:hypothetical protein
VRLHHHYVRRSRQFGLTPAPPREKPSGPSLREKPFMQCWADLKFFDRPLDGSFLVGSTCPRKAAGIPLM